MAYFIATLYKINKRREDFLGTILLKWLNEGSIEVKETGKTMFKNKPIYSIDLKINEKKYYQNNRELELFEMLKVASKDGILESNEFERWCSNNYTKVLKWFDNILKDEKLELTNKGYLILTEKKFLKIFTHKTYEVNYILKDKAIELAGLKKFLIDFSDIKNKEVIEVHLWKEYLMFAQIFGIANKVAKQFAKLYPNVITDINYDGIITVNSIARIGTMAAISSSASSSSGISSSLGGGGGAFGGSSGGGTR
jgi:uncharacterized membrane protein YgcG